MMNWILVLTRRFIPKNDKKGIIKSQYISIKNMLKLCFVCDLCYVDKQRFFKQINQIRFFLISPRVGGTPSKISFDFFKNQGARIFPHLIVLDRKVRI